MKKTLYKSDKYLEEKRRLDPKGYYPKLETPTLSRKVIVIEDTYFKEKLKETRYKLNKILNKYRKKIK